MKPGKSEFVIYLGCFKVEWEPEIAALVNISGIDIFGLVFLY